MNSSSRPFNNTFQPPSFPESALPGAEPQSGESSSSGAFSRSSDVASNFENWPRNNNEMTDLGSHRQIRGATLQARLSYDTIGRKVLLDVHDEGGVASADPASASGPRLQREPLPADSLPAAIPSTSSRGRQGTALHRETRELGVDPGARSPHDRVSPAPTRPRALNLSCSPPPQLASGADNPQRAPARPISTSKSYGAPSRREARAVQDEGLASPGPISSSTSMQPHMRPRPSVIPPITPVTLTVPPSRIPQEAVNISPGLPRTEGVEGNPYPFLQDSSRERSSIRPSVGAEQVTRTTSVQPSAKPLAYPSPSLNRPSISTSPAPPRPAPALTRTASNWKHRDITQRRLPEEFQARFRGTPSELRHPPDEGKEMSPSGEQGRKDPSDTPIRPPQPTERKAASNSLALCEPESHSRHLGRDNSRIRGDERANREAIQAPRAPGPEREREERGTRTEAVTALGRSQRPRVEPNPTVTHAPGLTSYLITPPDSPVVAGDYRDPNHESGPSTTRPDLHDSNSDISRGKPELPQALLALTPDRPEPLITPPPRAFLPIRDRHKPVVDVPMNIDSEFPDVGTQMGGLTSEGESKIRAPPSLSLSTSSPAFTLIAPIAFQGNQMKGGMLPGSTFPPNFAQPVMRSYSTSVPRIPQNERSTRTLRDDGGVLVDAPYRTFDLAKPSDRMGLVQPGCESLIIFNQFMV